MVNAVQQSSMPALLFELTPAQQKAVALLAAGESGRKTAQQVGVTPECLSHWRRLPSFNAALHSLRAEALGSARDALLALGTKAVQTLDDLMSSANDQIRLRAATAVLQLLQRDAPNVQPGAPPHLAEAAAPEEDSVAAAIRQHEETCALGRSFIRFARERGLHINSPDQATDGRLLIEGSLQADA